SRPHRGNLAETRPARDLRGHEFLAAPGADDDVGRGRDDFRGGGDAVLRALVGGAFGKNIEPAGSRDQFRDPADSTDHRLVPFFEIDSRLASARAGRGAYRRKPIFELGAQALGLLAYADQRAERAHHRKDPGEVALVESMDGDAAPDQ